MTRVLSILPGVAAGSPLTWGFGAPALTVPGGATGGFTLLQPSPMDGRFFSAGLWTRFRQWGKSSQPPASPVAPSGPPRGPQLPPPAPLSNAKVNFSPGVVTVDLSAINQRATIAFGRGTTDKALIRGGTLTVRVADERMADRHTTVHFIPEQRLAIIQDHGAREGTVMGGKRLFVESKFIALSPDMLSLTLQLGGTTVMLTVPKHLGPVREAPYDWRAPTQSISLEALKHTVIEGLRNSQTELAVSLHRLGDETLFVSATPSGDTAHGKLEVSLPGEGLDINDAGSIMGSLSHHLHIFQPTEKPTIHVTVDWLVPAAFESRLGPWVIADERLTTQLNRWGLVIFLSHGNDDSTDGFDWTIRPNATAGEFTWNHLTNKDGIPRIEILLPWYDYQHARAQIERAVQRIHVQLGQVNARADIVQAARQLFFVGVHT